MNSYRKDFPIFSNVPDLVYLDSAATSQKPQIVIYSVKDFYENYNSNIHRGLYKIAEKASLHVDEVRTKTARFIGAESESEIIFTKSATESVNFISRTWGVENIKENDIVVSTITEHHANFVPWQQLCLLKKAKFETVGITKDYKLNSDDILAKTKDAKVFALTYISNVLGVQNDIKDIIDKVRKQNKKIKILVDASQAAPHIKIDVKELDCDFMVFTGHKMFAETGVGVLYMRKNIQDETPPFLFGGDMIDDVDILNSTFAKPPRKFEAGTPNISGIISLGAAISYYEQVGFDNIFKHEQRLTKYCLQRLGEIKGIDIYGSRSVSNRHGIISFNINKIHAHDVAQILSDDIICVRAGHHCAIPLHKQLGITSSVRISINIYNNESDIDNLIKGLKKSQKIFN